jgi:hypothetical protein
MTMKTTHFLAKQAKVCISELILHLGIWSDLCDNRTWILAHYPFSQFSLGSALFEQEF